MSSARILSLSFVYKYPVVNGFFFVVRDYRNMSAVTEKVRNDLVDEKAEINLQGKDFKIFFSLLNWGSDRKIVSRKKHAVSLLPSWCFALLDAWAEFLRATTGEQEERIRLRHVLSHASWCKKIIFVLFLQNFCEADFFLLFPIWQARVFTLCSRRGVHNNKFVVVGIFRNFYDEAKINYPICFCCWFNWSSLVRLAVLKVRINRYRGVEGVNAQANSFSVQNFNCALTPLKYLPQLQIYDSSRVGQPSQGIKVN